MPDPRQISRRGPRVPRRRERAHDHVDDAVSPGVDLDDALFEAARAQRQDVPLIVARETERQPGRQGPVQPDLRAGRQPPHVDGHLLGRARGAADRRPAPLAGGERVGQHSFLRRLDGARRASRHQRGDRPAPRDDGDRQQHRRAKARRGRRAAHGLAGRLAERRGDGREVERIEVGDAVAGIEQPRAP